MPALYGPFTIAYSSNQSTLDPSDNRLIAPQLALALGKLGLGTRTTNGHTRSPRTLAIYRQVAQP